MDAAAAGDFIPPLPPNEKLCDSFIGFKRIILTTLDVTFLYMPVVNRVKAARDDFERAFKALNDLPGMNNIVIWPSTTSKSDLESRRLRLDADALMRKSDYRSALLKFNGAVLTAPPGSENLAQGFAGRAKALFYINDYRGCMENVDAALGVGSGQCLNSKSHAILS